jgi:aconitate hydratase
MLKTVAELFKGKTVAPSTSLLINPGSRQVLRELARKNDLEILISSGARMLEAACGPCIGMGGAPPDGGVSFRTYNRNFKGRSGTPNAQVYLCSPVTAALIAIKGEVVDPFRSPFKLPKRLQPFKAEHPDPFIQPPPRNPNPVKVIRGPNIKPIPKRKPLTNTFQARVLIKLGDHISTDDILPGGSEVLPFRSNIPAISRYAFSRIDPSFSERAQKAEMGLIVGGENYGQGSSREHAALVPMVLGIQAVLAKSFARIHLSNLINYGIVPLVFQDPQDYEKIAPENLIAFDGLHQSLQKGTVIRAMNKTNGQTILFKALVPPDKIKILLSGGLLPYLKRIKTRS